jgi:hypothetical protein
VDLEYHALLHAHARCYVKTSWIGTTHVHNW